MSLLATTTNFFPTELFMDSTIRPSQVPFHDPQQTQKVVKCVALASGNFFLERNTLVAVGKSGRFGFERGWVRKEEGVRDWQEARQMLLLITVCIVLLSLLRGF